MERARRRLSVGVAGTLLYVLVLVPVLGTVPTWLLITLWFVTAMARSDQQTSPALDLVWLAGAVFAAAAHVAGRSPRAEPTDADPMARAGWRVALIPLGSSVLSVAVLVSLWGAP